METRARYVLVGIFTIASLLAALGFTLWLAKVQIDRTYAQYDILFDTVAGLGQASEVQYNGVTVGKVLTIALDRNDPSLVRVRIEIFASTPVRVDTVATLASQGVTGVAYVALAGGSATSAAIEVVPPASVAVIASKPSVLQDLMTSAPDLLAEAIRLMRDIRGFTTPENGAALREVLANTASATAKIDAMAAQATTVLAAAEASLARADAALIAAEATFAGANGVIRDDVPGMIKQLESAVDAIATSAAGVETFTRNGLPQFTSFATEARGLVATINALTSRIGSDPGRFLLGNQTPDYRR